MLANELHDLARLGVASATFLGIEQIAIHCDLEPAAIAGDKDQLRCLKLKRSEQFLRQPDGAGGIVSDGAIFDADLHHGFLGLLGLHRSKFGSLVGWPDRRRCDYATGETNEQTRS